MVDEPRFTDKANPSLKGYISLLEVISLLPFIVQTTLIPAESVMIASIPSAS